MGSLKMFLTTRGRREFEAHLVNTSKQRAEQSKEWIKKNYGNRIQVRVVKAPSWGRGYDVFTLPDEREWNRLKRRR